MGKNKFSFIIPIYNIQEHYLRECIKSVQEQTIRDIEIILINDGSTNGIGAICDEIALNDKRIKVIHQVNKGVSAARNRGIEAASNEWIIFVDPDDWVDKNMCECVEKSISNEKTDILIFTFIEEMRNKQIPHYYGDREEFIFNYEDHNLLQLSIMNYYTGYNPLWVGTIWAKAFNKEFLIKNNLLFNENLPKAQDIIFCLHAFEEAKKVTYLNKAFYHYRINEDSICQKYNPKIYDYLSRVVSESKNFIEKYNKDERFGVAQNNMAVHVFRSNMRLDFLNNDNTNKYADKRKRFIEIVNSKAFNSALLNINLRDYSTRSKVEIILIKYKLFLPLYLLHRRADKKLEKFKYKIINI